MESKCIDDDLYFEINDKIMALYNERVGIEMNYEQITRAVSDQKKQDELLIFQVKEFFARVMAFWLKTVRELLDNEKEPNRVEAFEHVFKNGKDAILAMIKRINFDEQDKFEIYYRASRLIEDKYIKPIYQTKRFLESLLARADKYYQSVQQEIKEEGSNPIGLPTLEPILWLLNQDEWCPLWLNFKEIAREALAESPEEIRQEILGGSFATYMDFMCKAFPEGYGRKLLGVTHDKFLMAELLWKMREGVKDEEEKAKENVEKREVLKKKLKSKLKEKR